MIYLAFTLLFVYDYFPDNFLSYKIPKEVMITVFVGLFLFSLFFKRFIDTDDKVVLRWQISSTAYILFLMGLLTALGGKSVSGISFDSGYLWIVFLFLVFDMYSKWKKMKRSKTANSEETHLTKGAVIYSIIIKTLIWCTPYHWLHVTIEMVVKDLTWSPCGYDLS